MYREALEEGVLPVHRIDRKRWVIGDFDGIHYFVRVLVALAYPFLLLTPFLEQQYRLLHVEGEHEDGQLVTACSCPARDRERLCLHRRVVAAAWDRRDQPVRRPLS